MEDFNIVTAYSHCDGSEECFSDCTSVFDHESNLEECDHSMDLGIWC